MIYTECDSNEFEAECYIQWHIYGPIHFIRLGFYGFPFFCAIRIPRLNIDAYVSYICSCASNNFQ